MSRLQFSSLWANEVEVRRRRRLSMPAPQKLPSGSARDLLLLAMAKVTDVSVKGEWTNLEPMHWWLHYPGLSQDSAAARHQSSLLVNVQWVSYLPGY